MNTMWGPALDAEVAYRAERLGAAARLVRRTAREDGPGDVRDNVRRPAERSTAGPGTSRGRSARGWHLPGSGAWHAAR